LPRSGCFWVVCRNIYYKSGSFSSCYSVLGLFLAFTYGIFTQQHARRESEVHKEELQHVEAVDAVLFLIQVLANIVLGKVTKLQVRVATNISMMRKTKKLQC
jgi:hypothetical protein